MRDEKQMYDLILGYAKNDERVRAVILNGSRADPNAPRDKYMDFDIVYVVNDFNSFMANKSFIDVFGERLILQMPEAMRNPCGDGTFNFLILFTDGNRIDLTLVPIERQDLIKNESATVALLDKDGILPHFPPASDKDHIVKRPSELFYCSCCNNFFWCMQNVAKGIVRGELPYVTGMYHICCDELNDMVSWWIGTKCDFSVNTGKMGKYFKKYLPAGLYRQYLDVYCNYNYENIWNTVFSACELFRILAQEVADSLNYTYIKQDDEGIMTYLLMMRDGKL